MKFSSAPISNTQFRPRTMRSGDSYTGANKTMDVPIIPTRSGSIRIKRNARAGKKYHWASGG